MTTKVTFTIEVEHAGLVRVIKGAGEHEDATAAMDLAFEQVMQEFTKATDSIREKGIP